MISVHHSALKHGIPTEDTLTAAQTYVFSEALDEENPWRELRLGFDTNGRLLELVVLIFDSGNELVIHSMKARKQYWELL